MEFKAGIEAGLRDALKSKDSLRVSVLRMVLAAIKNKEVEKRGTLTDEEFLGLIRKSVNQHNESIDSFRKGNRPDLVEREEKELEILKQFLPASLSEQEIEQEIEKAIEAVGAVSQKDMGKVMKYLLEKHPGKIDGKALSAMVVKRLSGK
jgi:uncharacterized protein YqeY